MIRPDEIVIGIDPSMSSAGYALVSCLGPAPKLIGCGQGEHDAVADDIAKLLGFYRFAGTPLLVVRMIAVEDMYPAPGLGTGKHLHRLGYATGYLTKAIRDALVGPRIGYSPVTTRKELHLWSPQPNQWRKHVGLKQGKREEIEKEAYKIAARFAGDTELMSRGPRGGKKYDEAMAICIAFAASRKVYRDDFSDTTTRF